MSVPGDSEAARAAADLWPGDEGTEGPCTGSDGCAIDAQRLHRCQCGHPTYADHADWGPPSESFSPTMIKAHRQALQRQHDRGHQGPVDEPGAVGAGDAVRCLRRGAAAPPVAQLSHVYAPVRAEQDRIRRDHRAAQVRRLARLRARRRCEDLAELLGQMALRPRDPDQAADLLRRSLIAAREIERLVTGACGARPRPWQPRGITAQTLSCLEQIVEELDAAIREAPLAAEAGDAEARRLAVELATTLAGGIEGLIEGLVATRARR
jgi:hypothetical protein